MRARINQAENPNDPPGVGGVWLEKVSEAARALAGAQMADQRGHSTTPPRTLVESTITVTASRDRLLGPEFALAPSLHQRKRSALALVGGLGLLLGVAIPADFATKLPVSDLWGHLTMGPTMGLASSRLGPARLGIPAEPAVPRLIVHTSPAVSGEPAPLGVVVEGQAEEGAVVAIRGLAPGMELSTGRSVSAGVWEVLATDLGVAWIGPPENFVGSVDLVAELRLPDEKIADQQAIHFDWVPESSPTLTQNKFNPEEIRAVPTISSPPAQTQLSQEIEAAPPSSQTFAQNKLDQNEIAGESPISPRPSKTQLDEGEIAAVSPSTLTLPPNQLDQNEITGGPPITPTPAPTQFGQEEIAAVPLSSWTLAQNQLDQTEITGERPISPTSAQIPPDQEEATATTQISRTLAQNKLDREEITAVPTILPTPVQTQLKQEESIATSPPPGQNQLDREEITEEPPGSPAAAPNRLIMAEPRLSPTRAQYQPDRDGIRTMPLTSLTPAQHQLDQEKIPVIAPLPPAAAKRQVDHEEITILLKRGKDLIASGDLAAARLVLQRAANANDAEAALALGATYDPFVLRELKVYGLTADSGMARIWYEKAKEYGSEAATRRLEILAKGVRAAGD